MLNQQKEKVIDFRCNLFQLFILFALWLWAFWPHVVKIFEKAYHSSETAHALVMPVAAVLLIYLRRKAFLNAFGKGSIWGLFLLAAGLTMFGASIWPFTFAYAQDVAVVVILSGMVMVTCGWKFFFVSMPVMLLVLASIPFGPGIYTRLIIRPETYTIAACARLLDLLPGVDTTVKGIDIIFSANNFSGVIALGESYRGVRLVQPFIAFGILIVFSQARTLIRLLAIFLSTAPLVFFCNFLRFLCWSLVVIYARIGIVSSVPRCISAVVSLVIFYGLLLLICNAKINLFIEEDEEGNL